MLRKLRGKRGIIQGARDVGGAEIPRPLARALPWKRSSWRLVLKYDSVQLQSLESTPNPVHFRCRGIDSADFWSRLRFRKWNFFVLCAVKRYYMTTFDRTKLGLWSPLFKHSNINHIRQMCTIIITDFFLISSSCPQNPEVTKQTVSYQLKSCWHYLFVFELFSFMIGKKKNKKINLIMH